MSKDRARRRAAREAEVVARAADRERRASAEARRAAWWSKLTGWLPQWSGPTPGLLAAKRRRRTGLLLLGFVATQVLTWAATPDWGTRFAVALVSIFAFPLIAVFAT